MIFSFCLGIAYEIMKLTERELVDKCISEMHEAGVTYGEMADIFQLIKLKHEKMKKLKANVFLQQKGLNHTFKMNGSNFKGTLLELLKEYETIR